MRNLAKFLESKRGLGGLKGWVKLKEKIEW
jgi:hypothetical protein